MSEVPRHVVALVGPTASGKTAVAIAFARAHAVEVISADSRQLRAGMSIGTAAPTEAELATVPHHLVGTIAPDAPWSLAEWLLAAREAIEGIWSRGALPLVVGGTGQYVWALLEGWTVPAVTANWEGRTALEAFAREHGAAALHARLAAVDQPSAARIAPANVRRVVRALEIVEATGAPVPPLGPREPGFSSAVVGLRWPRAELHRRADARVEAMFSAASGGGIVEEARAVVAVYGRSYPALDSIGYREALGVIEGAMTLQQAIARTKTETHRLMRMQANWFSEDDPRIRWVDGGDVDAAVEAVESAARPPVP